MHQSFRKLFFIFSFSILWFSSCKKEDKVIPGNIAPEDPTISNLLKENFVQKAYLNLCGKQPSDSEMNASLLILNKNNCSVNNREEFLNHIFSGNEYRLQLYNLEINDLLNGMSDNEIDQAVIFFQNQLNDPANANDYYIINAELEKTKLLQSLKANILNGTVNMVSAHKIIADSPSYEDYTGSGSEWIKAIFLRFFFREPTGSEMSACTEMLGDRAETLFFKEGSSRDDLVNIIFSSREYYEGQVRTLYQRYLFRDPDANESVILADQYQKSSDYMALQKQIMLENEFLGIK
jgi:hypothetical protein